MMNPDGMGVHWLFPIGIIGGLSWLLVVVGAVLLVTWAVRAMPGRAVTGGGAAPAAPPTRETPLEILARRFAMGEITAEEFQRGRELLGGGPPQP